MKAAGHWFYFFLWAFLIFLGSSIPAVSVSGNGLVDFLSHKTVHLFEYSVFYLLLYRALVGGKAVMDWGLVSWAILLTVLYAVSDEWHQSFTPGREARLEDVFVDFLGGGMGIVLWKFLQGARKEPST